MRWRRVLTFTVVMAVGMGCPESWREGSTIDRAMAKDIQEALHRHDCPLSKEEWLEKCEDPAQWVSLRCPHECQFRIAE